MKRKVKSKTQIRPTRRKISNLIALSRQIYANRKLIFSALCLTVAAISWGVGYLSQAYEYTSDKAMISLKRGGFSLNEILVEGREHTPPAAIMQAINISRGDSIFRLDLKEAQKKLKEIPWIYSAMIQRRLPSTIYIRLSEREPIAIWQQKSKLHLIDSKGAVIDKFDKKEFTDLIVVTGKDANLHANEFLNILHNYPGLKESVKGAAFISGRRWDIILENKVRVKLPESNPEKALERLVKMQQEHQLADGHLDSIDLRLPDRSFLYVQPQDHDKKNKGSVT